ncbi:N-acetylglutamate synthase-like GNAT family acetyltransferase [Pseudomonas sp. SJZ079]|uniref:GNAT family N-acetyltransferase n=1 Tax=Pseudomonas sp. SJZ079 TaxID=2572887 RepID=UPI00119BB012|nr:GNAT family N-acetyltransferase [Pseudomonas sp. SJZ079]TWC43002.1 N-acetylglutamate synthase-like GNAT family acetyltransferase [Pseudomonas sp. SJZ079]
MSQPNVPHLPDSPFASFSVRAACSGDAQALAGLLQQLGDDEPRADPTLLALRLSELPHSRVVLVAERDGRLLGTCTVNLIEHLAHNFARSAILEDLVVHADVRGLGIGQRLIASAVERARAWGCYKLALSSNLSREAAHRFYAQQGFKPHGISLALTLD